MQRLQYLITEEHLKNALEGMNGVHFIKKANPQDPNWFPIEISQKGSFWTSENSLLAMKDNSRKWIT